MATLEEPHRAHGVGQRSIFGLAAELAAAKACAATDVAFIEAPRIRPTWGPKAHLCEFVLLSSSAAMLRPRRTELDKGQRLAVRRRHRRRDEAPRKSGDCILQRSHVGLVAPSHHPRRVDLRRVRVCRRVESSESRGGACREFPTMGRRIFGTWRHRRFAGREDRLGARVRDLRWNVIGGGWRYLAVFSGTVTCAAGVNGFLWGSWRRAWSPAGVSGSETLHPDGPEKAKCRHINGPINGPINGFADGPSTVQEALLAGPLNRLRVPGLSPSASAAFDPWRGPSLWALWQGPSREGPLAGSVSRGPFGRVRLERALWKGPRTVFEGPRERFRCPDIRARLLGESEAKISGALKKALKRERARSFGGFHKETRVSRARTIEGPGTWAASMGVDVS
ncbi:hypothetical protein M885DRAFT_66419 [Pelagophyceae sp. CCMP2097]|nr:hypothetical protein M885DRAFT_66419 [Pelagophyceae sp. CCMP2097]